MSLGKFLKRVGKALPAIVANAPAVIDAAKQVRKALKKRKRRAPPPPQAGG